MLGRLFSSAASHGRSPSSLESATEEQYTRNLLFSENPLPSSPLLHTPAPALRVGTFDDHNGFDVNEKDIRIIVAQDAYADQDRPSILFDSNASRHHVSAANTAQSPKSVPAARHERTASGVSSAKSYFALQSDTSASNPLRSPTGTFHVRNRGSTVSGGQAGQPLSPIRDFESKELTNDILECMFGASSSTKHGTRMHIIKSGDHKIPRVPSSPLVSTDPLNSRAVNKPALVRAQTSQPSTDDRRNSGDRVLITRIFTVAPPDSDKDNQETIPKSSVVSVDASVNLPERSKPPKLREKKTLAFGVCMIVPLPRQSSGRPVSRHGGQGDELHHGPSVASSFGSDMQSSWTFLETLPPSLSSSRSQSTVDGHIDFVLRRWDVADRHLSVIERSASGKIFELLCQIDETSTGRKTPKENRMQRINQKIIRLPPFSLAHDQEISRQSSKAIGFMTSALSIPAVRPLAGGHWLEEARLVARICSQNGHDRFLAILLTTFLGNHFEWINEIGQELHEKRPLLKWKFQKDASAMRSRTVIICEDRILARRLVFLLASFLFPGMLSLRSLSSPDVRRLSVRRQPRHVPISTDHPTSSNLSTSVSSADEDRSGRRLSESARRKLRQDLAETSSLKGHLSIPHQDSNFHKSSAGTTTTVTPNPSTPLAYVASDSKESDGYFFASPNAAAPSSAAAVSLQRLRRSSSAASSMPSTWGSLLGSIWSNKQNSSAATSNITGPSKAQASTSTETKSLQNRGLPANQLERMVKEVGRADIPGAGSHKASLLSSQEEKADLPPRLEVDERDGVVDVDLNLPNLLLYSYASSPDVLPTLPTPLSTSTASLDDARSFSSVRSSPKTSADYVNNIAGYLKQYHPDFTLQAVRSCSEKDVRESMTGALHAENGATSAESSYDESNTLIADARDYSVRRLTLRRKPQRRETVPDSERSSTSTLQDEFSLDSIISYDETLADAIDRALDKPSAVPSRLPSPSPSKSQHFRTVSTSTTSTVNASSPLATSLVPASTKDTLQPVPVPQGNRGQLIIDALKEVVGEVDRDLHQRSSQRAENIPMSTKSGPPMSKPRKTEENVLRDGVKRWLQRQDETSVW